MQTWPRYPTIYEINTWVWLADLSARQAAPVDLGSVPTPNGTPSLPTASMQYGSWECGSAVPPASPSPTATPACSPISAVLCPTSVPKTTSARLTACAAIAVDAHLGGPDGLAVARKQLAKRGLRLLLDFVPNHVAPDHPWVAEHPEYFIQGTADDAAQRPRVVRRHERRPVFACGRDPYFPAWPDVLQFNAFAPGLASGGARYAITALPDSATAFAATWRCCC